MGSIPGMGRSLEEGMVTHPSILAWKIPQAQEPGGLRRWGICLAAQETRVQSLGREDPLEKGMTTLSRFLSWEIPRTEEPGGLQSMGSQRVGHD